MSKENHEIRVKNLILWPKYKIKRTPGYRTGMLPALPAHNTESGFLSWHIFKDL